MNCGDIVTVNFPFTDHSGGKIRPALIVSTDEFNTGADVIFVPISSAPKSDPYVFTIEDAAPYFPQTGLKRTSAVKWTKPMTVARSVVHAKLGTLPPTELAAIQANIRRMFTQV